MNTLFSNVRFTLRSIFNLYSAPGRRLYANSLVFIIWAGLIGGLIATGFVLLLGHLYNVQEIIRLGTEELPWYTLLSTPQFLGSAQGILLLFLALYGIAILRKQETEEPIKPDLPSMLSTITSGEWKAFAISIALFLTVSALLFINPFATDLSGTGLLGTFSGFTSEFTFAGMAYDAIQVVKNLLLPCFLAMLIVIYSIRGKLNLDIVREYKSAWATGLLLLFSLNAVFSAASHLFSDTVIRLLTIPIILLEPSNASIAVVALLGTLGTLLIAAIFYPSLALSLISPFRYEEELDGESIKEEKMEEENNGADYLSSDPV